MGTILDIFMTTILGMVGFIGLTTVLKTINSSKKHPAVLFGEVLAKNDIETSNALHRCNNENCITEFFRTYHLFEAYKSGSLEIPGDPTPNEKTYTENLPVDVLDRFGLIRCPNCASHNVSRAIEYDWMKTNPDFPYLNEKELKLRRVAFDEQHSEDAVLKRLDAVHASIKEVQEITSFNAYHKLETEIDKKTDNALFNIRSEVEQILNTSIYDSVQQKSLMLLELISRSGDRFFIEDTSFKDWEPSIYVDVKRAKPLEKAIRKYNDFHSKSRRSLHSQIPDADFQHEINQLQEEYLGVYAPDNELE